jgi:hypothetical protein
MTYSAGLAAVVPPMVSAHTLGWALLAMERITGSESASGVFEAANRAVYLPILVPTTCVVRRLWWANGATVSASYNVDVGIYLDAGYKPGTRLLSTGSTAQGTASQVQFVDVTHTPLAPGRYWLAIACSSGSATFFRITPTYGDEMLRFQQATAMALPSSATPAQSDNNPCYLFGFATTASP